MSQEKPKLNEVKKEAYSEEAVADIVRKFQEGSWKKVLNEESVGGNAGANKAAINAYIEKKTGRIIIFGNYQYLPKEVVSNPDYTNAVFVYDFGNLFERLRSGSLDIEPGIFEKVSAPGASEQALENLKEALIRFDREYVEWQLKKGKK
ncbi:MAG: hypothetical protein HYT63_04045 [Candidatus Yanofskybacteria bacterium]|nr:hypothetical protein [Candidatus Yanofskybacteria bacterium]